MEPLTLPRGMVWGIRHTRDGKATYHVRRPGWCSALCGWTVGLMVRDEMFPARYCQRCEAIVGRILAAYSDEEIANPS